MKSFNLMRCQVIIGSNHNEVNIKQILTNYKIIEFDKMSYYNLFLKDSASL